MLTKKERLNKLTKRINLAIAGEKGRALPIFVFGMQRSGTTMLADIFRKSNEIETYHENDEEAFDAYRLRSRPHIETLIDRSPAHTVVFKPIMDSQHALHILNRHPGARAIWIFRDYVDVVNSALRNWKEHYKQLDYILHDRKTANWRVEKMTEENIALVRRFYDKKISDASSSALFWYLRNDLFFQQNLHHDDRVILVKYENIVSNPKTDVRRLFDFLGVTYYDKVVQGIHAKSIKKNRAENIDPEIEAMCDAMLERLLACMEAHDERMRRGVLVG